MVSTELVLVSRLPRLCFSSMSVSQNTFPTLLLPVPSVTTDLKPVSFPCDSFSWQAAKYLSSCVHAWLQFWLNFTLLKYPFTTGIAGRLSRRCVMNWSDCIVLLNNKWNEVLGSFLIHKNLVKANYYSYIQSTGMSEDMRHLNTLHLVAV